MCACGKGKGQMLTDISILIDEHSPKENETSFALKNIVFQRTLLKLALFMNKSLNDYATKLNVCSLGKTVYTDLLK